MSELREELLRANIRRADAEAYSLELSNTLQEMEVAQDTHSSLAARTYTYYATVKPQTTADCIFQIKNWFRQDPEKPIRIELFSPGGDVFPGFALYDTIRHLRSQGAIINIKAIGYAASMASVILQAGSERIISPNGFIMIHEIGGGMDGTLADMKDQTKLFDRLQEKANDALLERSTLTRTQLKARYKRQDCWLDAEEALALRLIDRIEE